jgi:hypothetical protein
LIAIDNVLISDDLVNREFVCDLNRCKGGCCEEGDAGAPLDKEELKRIDTLFEKIKPYLTPAALEEIERKGKYVYHKEFGWVTPTLGDDREICVYGFRDEKGWIRCAFEQAYYDGLIDWKKPISCHLYPVIHEKGRKGNFDRLNYEPREKLCQPACAFGKKLKVPVYQFLKEPLIRLYGEAFYNALEQAAQRVDSEAG